MASSPLHGQLSKGSHSGGPLPVQMGRSEKVGYRQLFIQKRTVDRYTVSQEYDSFSPVI